MVLERLQSRGLHVKPPTIQRRVSGYDRLWILNPQITWLACESTLKTKTVSPDHRLCILVGPLRWLPRATINDTKTVIPQKPSL